MIPTLESDFRKTNIYSKIQTSLWLLTIKKIENLLILRSFPWLKKRENNKKTVSRVISGIEKLRQLKKYIVYITIIFYDFLEHYLLLKILEG